MARRCTVCAHLDVAAINTAMLNHKPFLGLAKQFGLKRDALVRHYDTHLPAAMAKAKEEADIRRAIDHVAQFKALNAATVTILAEARRARDNDLALRAIDRLQRQIELQLRVIGELDDRPQINLLVSAEWLAVRGAVLSALRDYPEARLAVAEALAGPELAS